MTIWTVKFTVYGNGEVTADARTLREACDIAYLVLFSQVGDANLARQDANYIERQFKTMPKHTKSTGIDKRGFYSIEVIKR